MSETLRETGAHIAAWFPTALAVLALLAGGMLLLLRSKRPGAAATPRFRRAATSTALFFLVGALIGLGVAFGPMRPLFSSAARLDARVGQTVPEMEFRRVSDDAPLRLGDFRGQVLLVNLWATWCPPCRHELPSLSRLQDAYRSRGLTVITLSDEKREALARVVDGLAPAAVNGYVASYGWLAIRNFRPFTLVIDRDGILRDYLFGNQEYEVFERKVGKYLD